MSMRLLAAMKQAISSVMDMMFFLPVRIGQRPGSPAECFSTEQLLGAMLRFDGPVSGISYLVMPAGFAGEITADFLGLAQEQVTERHICDTVKEALNMIVGKMLSELDKAGVFRLGLPELIRPGEPAFTRLAGFQGETILVETEKSCLAAGIALDPERKSN